MATKTTKGAKAPKTIQVNSDDCPGYAPTYDAWRGSVESAMVADADCQLPEAHPARPIFQWHAAQIINGEKAKCETDGFAVLACVRKCANHDLVMPEWLARAFIRRYDTVLTVQAGSWDDQKAFGKPYPKGVHLSSLRFARENRLAIFRAVCAAAQGDIPIDKTVFASVGNTFGVKATTVQKLYYQAVEMWGRGAKGKPRERAERRDKNAQRAGKLIASVKWGAAKK
jgi:hypothetical protein